MVAVILPANSASSGGGYDVANSLRFNSGSSDSLTRSTTAGNRTTWTFSTWFKRSKLGVLQSILEHDDSNYFRVRITSGDVFEVFDSNTNKLWSWHPLLRDTSAWYHIVIRGDSTDGTNANRLRLYINGTLASANAVASIDQNYTFSFNQGGTLQIGKRGSTDYLDGYLAETILIDGSALAPDEFGEFDEDSGIWKPINVSGLTFGTRGFYLEFKESGTSANSSGLGADTSGNNHHFTLNNLTSIDQSQDTCTNNFCVLNDQYYYGNTFTFSEGNTKATTDSNWKTAGGTIGMNSGKWYWEFKAASSNYVEVGIGDLKGFSQGGSNYQGLSHTKATDAYGIYYNASNGEIYSNNTSGAETNPGDYGASWSTEVIGCALDLDSSQNTVTFYKSNSSQGAYDIQDPVEGYTPSFTIYANNCTINFGGTQTDALSSAESDENGYGSFEYAPPSGYLSICTKNLAENS
tara:strand:+ start:1078 stop:2469 length:1392 start_codon:yes stop_codon:yes gene_type:complete